MKYSTDTYAVRQQKTELYPPSTRVAILCNFIEKRPARNLARDAWTPSQPRRIRAIFDARSRGIDASQ